MESPLKRERSMPFFLLASMILHALLFLIAPKVISGMFPGTHVGEQGGLTYVTLVDAPQFQQPRAAVAEAARRPQARPAPQARPTPASSSAGESQASEAAQTSTPTPPQPQPEPVVVQAQPTPASRPPQQSRPEPVLTSPRSDAAVTDTESVEDLETSQAMAEAGSSGPDGTDLIDEVASLPEAEIDAQPQLPPTGESMLNSFGGSTFPKNAVGLFRGSVEVEVAAIVSADGRLIDAVVVDGSGISVVDTHAENVVRHLIQFKPYDAMYEMRVFITFNSADQDRLHFRYSEFITSPPIIGTYDTEGGL